MIRKRPDTANADNIETKLRKLPKLLCNFEPGDIQSMCEMASILVAGYEYWIVSRQPPIVTVPGQDEIARWYTTHYLEQIVLVLSYEEKYYKYTRNNVAKSQRLFASQRWN
jgi:hypothetical protein